MSPRASNYPKALRRRWLVLVHLGLVALMLALGAGNVVAGGELVAVVHANNKESIDLSEFRRLFMGDTTFWAGNVPVRLFIRPTDHPAGDAFFHAIHVIPARYRRVWQEKQLSGQGTVPESVPLAEVLVGKIAADPGSIGFVLSDEISPTTAGVRLVPLN